MVNCLKVFLLVLLSPIPTAPTLFLLSFFMLMVLEHQPCPYCSLLIMMLFQSTCSFYGSGDDHTGCGPTTCWMNPRSLLDFRSQLNGVIYRDNVTDFVSLGLIPDAIIRNSDDDFANN
ncbi:hypothetical protein HK100_008596 [Physocladia obscura]|uniref:Uncharacterized protein n=1 Tax=Physocladia obscura TaxID=109957 RepID=A0AAD5T4M7_9FUNG|nr:hypothetical protein HK100_008596 [Physocladia obscura]